MEIFGPLQKVWEKKGSDHIREMLNPYGENPNYGEKTETGERLSNLNFFSHNSVGDHIPFYNDEQLSPIQFKGTSLVVQSDKHWPEP